ncbi:MAG: transposase [Candidatus Nitrosopolaris sp.]
MNGAYPTWNKSGGWNIMVSNTTKTTHKKKAGRLRMNNRQAMNAIFYILRTGCQWNALPSSLGASSTVHDIFQEWRTAVYSSICGLMVC